MTRPSMEWASRLGAVKKFVLLAALLAVVFLLPYQFNVTPNVSRSYVAGFNNGAAVLLFLLGSLFFAVCIRGRIAEPGRNDSRLAVWALLLALGGTLAVCTIRLYVSPDGSPGGETYYFLNRQQMLLAGLLPYTQFEFVYGPMMLYPNVWLTGILHLSILHGYVATWILSWLVGVWMIWTVVGAIDLPIPSRNTMFCILLAMELVWTDFGGLNYTPLRKYAAAFCLTVLYRVWCHAEKPWKATLMTVIALAALISYSPDQAVGASVGMLSFLGLLVLCGEVRFPWSALATTVAGVTSCYAVAFRLGWLRSMGAFASGGYSYPLVPSLPIIVAIIGYLAGVCLLIRLLTTRHLQSVEVPLTLGGCALLPSAFGRCDILHITAAIPAFVAGFASLYGMPSLRRWWASAAIIGLILVPFGVRRGDRFWTKVVPEYPVLSRVVHSSDPDPSYRDLNQTYVSSSNIFPSALPCDRTYFSPVLSPVPTEPLRPRCLDTGYYLGLVDVITPEGIQYKVNELRDHQSVPLLMENRSLNEQFPILLGGMRSLARESATLWLPPRRHTPITYAPISDYILANYVPGPTLADGQLRIWYPKSTSDTDAAPPPVTLRRP